MNWTFLAFALAVVAGGYQMWRRNRASRGDRTTTTNVPGYSVTSGEAFGVDPDVALVKGEQWRAETIETLHSGGRSRIVLTIDVAEKALTEQIHELLAACAREVARRSRANVVYIEAESEATLRAALMWSPDGRGWNGVDDRSEIFIAREVEA